MLISARPAPLRRSHHVLLVALLASATLAPATAGASGQQILADCAAGTLASSYPLDDYRDALENMPADMAEYTACPLEIKTSRDRMLATAGGNGRATSRAKTSSYGAAAPAAAPASGAAGISVPAAPSAAATAADDTDAGSAREGAPKETTPRTSPQAGPQQDATTDEGFYAVPIAGTGGGDASGDAGDGGGGVPVIPAVIAFSLIALTGARALIGWSRRPEHLGDDQGSAAGRA